MRPDLVWHWMRIGWRGRGFRAGLAGRQRGQDRRIDAEHPAKWAQDLRGVRGGAQEFRGVRGAHENLEVTRVGRGLVRNGADQPGFAARQGLGARPGRTGARRGEAGLGEGIGLETGDQAGETVLRAGEIPGERDHQMGQARIAGEAVGDEIFEAADHPAEARG